MRGRGISLTVFLLFANVTYAGVYCNQGEVLSTDCGDVDMYGCCDGSAVIFCEPATGNLCKWDCENNVLTPGGNCYGKCGGYKQAPSGAILCGCDPECVALDDCCDDICDDCADIIPECVDASGSTICGWETTKGWYDCMTTPVPGPANHPMQCSFTTNEHACVPDCAGKSCGLDGCGSVCGECLIGTQCTLEGFCEYVCTPNCAVTGNACGDDGCGGSCGYCGGLSECKNGQCAPLTIDDPPEEPSPDTTTFIAPPEKDIAESHNNNNNSGGGSFIIPIEEEQTKETESSGCSIGQGETAFVVWALISLGLLYIIRRKYHQ